MRRTVLTISAILLAFASFGQTDVYRSGYFNSIWGQINSEWAGLIDNGVWSSKVKTFELWIKRDTIITASDGYMVHTPSGTYLSPGNLLAMYIHGGDTSLHCIWSGNDIHTHFAFDTNWHHIAFTCDTLSVYDTLTLYVDGIAAVGGKFLHTTVTAGCATLPQTYIASHVTYLLSSAPVPDAFFHGNMCKLLFADTILYSSSFIPDCVFDSVGYWSGGTIKLPYRLSMPLSNDVSSYFPAYMYPLCDSVYSLSGAWYPKQFTSPCAPTYTFHCPPSDTILYTGTDTVLKVVNINASYMKGSHIAIHKNGWLNPSTVTADYTTGVFTDTLLVTTPGSYPYISSYRNDTQKTVVVLHDGSGSAGILLIYQNEVQLYPNPVKNQLTLNVPIANVTMNVVNLLGQEVLTRKLSDSLTYVDVSELTSGLYIIMFNGSLVAKFIKE